MKRYLGPFLAALIAVALAWALVMLSQDAQGQQPPLQRSKYDDRLDTLDRQAIETAYTSQIEHLYSVWMKDSSGQPTRAVSGARVARSAYIAAMTEIEKR